VVNRPPGSSREQGRGAADYFERADGLRARLSRPRATEAEGELELSDLDSAVSSLDVMANRDTAVEELRVADEEVQVQQDQISRLLESQQILRWQHDRMLEMLPVPVLVTDAEGMIRSVNSAAAVLSVRRVAWMVGRPVFTLFQASDRPELRRLLISQGASVRPARGTVESREGHPIGVDVWLLPRPGEPDSVTWVLLTPDHHRGRRELESVPEALTELADLAVDAVSVQEVLNHAVAICRRTLVEAEVSINIGPPDQPESVASTSLLAQTLDGAQLAAGDGPCLAAFASRSIVTSPDLRADERWPQLARFLPAEQVSVVVGPIEVRKRPVGTLHVYRTGLPLEPWAEEAAELLAATLGAVCHELELKAELHRLREDMQRALASRATIEQAKGIVMAQRGCGPDAAFAYLADLSSDQERKLRDVAREIVEQASSTN
jgi:PAS domain-containing protein